MLTERRPHFVLGVTPVTDAARLEALTHLLGRPRHHPIGGVIEHLRDDVPPSPWILAALDLDERWNAFGVKEEMVKRPAAGAIFVFGAGRLPLDEQPSSAAVGVAAGEHLWVV